MSDKNKEPASSKEGKWYIKFKGNGVEDIRRSFLANLEYSIAKPVVIGRAIECDLTVLRSYISRNHAELKIEDGVLWVNDLGSSNGTLVNGVRISGSHPLSHGDELRFKDVVFQVREDRSQFKSDAMLNQTMFIDKPEIG